jgi:phosphate-selective porin OprO/OprP
VKQRGYIQLAYCIVAVHLGLAVGAHASGEIDAPAQKSPEAPSAPAAETTTEKATKESPAARFNLSEGLVGETTDGSFRYHVGGRFDWDSGWYNAAHSFQQSLNTPLFDGTDLRRFRLGVDGTVWEQVDFKLEADFSKASDFKNFQSTPQTNIFITDAWIALRDLPVVDTLKAGHQKEYLTFSNATSAKFLPFMERPYIFDAFENDFSWDNGISMNRTDFDERMTIWAGVFWNGTRSEAFNTNGNYAASGRVTCLPLYDEAEQLWLNIGVSASVRAFNENDPNSITVRPLVRTGQSFDIPNLINTGSILSQDSSLHIAGAGVHSAWGPLTVGGEFLCWSVDNAFKGGLPNPDGTLPPGATRLGNLFFSGYYIEVLYFLTPGDHRPINRTTPGYDRLRPASNFHCTRGEDGPCCNGIGAWEIGVRYDHVDVNSGSLQAGTLDSVTFGVNWFLNPNTRVTANYVYTNLTRAAPTPSGNFDALGVRFHFDF